jgi:DNA-binding NarL/FixJ family response regulator
MRNIDVPGKINIGIVDDHKLIRQALRKIFDGRYNIIFEAENGKVMIEQFRQLTPIGLPQTVILDINMPEMNGYETMTWLNNNYPDINVLVLTMNVNEDSMLEMLKSGAKGYLSKDAEIEEIFSSISKINMGLSHFPLLSMNSMIHEIRKAHTSNDMTIGKEPEKITQRELEIIKLMATDLTYQQIADKLFLTTRTIDNYRMKLFEKFNVKTRVTLVLFAIKNGLISVDNII